MEEVCEGLAQQGQFLTERGVAEWPDGTVSGQYGFRHGLYQDVLYQRLSAGRRARTHLAVGIREESGYGAQASERAVELARHFTQGRDIAQAARYLRLAGQNALRLSAHAEALSHFAQGLTLLAAQPETPARMQQELGLQIGLGVAHMATKGFAAPEVESAFLRAHVLCQQIGDTPDLFHMVVGLWAFYCSRGDLLTAKPLAEQLLRLAHDTGNAALLAVAHGNMQLTLYSQGQLEEARAHGEQALTRFATVPPFPLVFRYGPDPAVRAQDYAAVTLYVLGYPDQALQEARAALVAAQELRHTQTVAATLQVIAGIHGGRGEWAEMQLYAAKLRDLGATHGLPFWWAVGQCNHGIAVTQQNNPTEGVSQIQQGLAVYSAAGATMGIPRILGFLAEAYGRIGRLDEGVQALAEAFALINQSDERVWEAELYRRKGELTLQLEAGSWALDTSPHSAQVSIPKSQVSKRVAQEVEGYFLKAIDIAQQQRAKSWKLRAVMSLARLWRCQGKKTETRQMVAEVYRWFTEGLDTADLQEAKALLETLGHTPNALRRTKSVLGA